MSGTAKHSCYPMPGTDVSYSATMQGTEMRYAALTAESCVCSSKKQNTENGIGLRFAGTEMRYDAMRSWY
eukprot:2243401-Rhodomonas_salina.1